MSVMKKVVTLLHGSVREIGESVVDANATRIYEREIFDARHNIESARGELTLVMAKETQSARAIERLQGEMARYEQLAVEALNKSRESLAEEVAAKVGELEHDLQEQTRTHASYALQVSRLKALIKTAELRIREQEREIAIARTTESVYKATRSICESVSGGGSKRVNARESLERIKQRHEALADRTKAADALDRKFGHGALEQKLAAAGIGPNANLARKAMERIRARQAASSAEAAE